VLQLDEQEAFTMQARCPNCKATVESEFALCPNCLTSLKSLCGRCNQQLKMDWKICPYCKAPVTEEGNQAADPSRLLPAAESSDEAPAAEPAPAPPPPPARRVATSLRQEQPSSNGSEITTAPAKTPRILIVDDDAAIRLVVAKSLEQLPFDVNTELASNGSEGVEIASKSHPDLIILDVMMPGMDGFAVCEKLRSQVETAFIPVMMLTANPSEEGRIRGYMVGTDDYVSKPFNVAELNARVTRLLRRAYGIS
jgi:CheY-like chemotaxis protein/RNA polymerase subunit RPABC4/transcription elongation factor Spt4